MDSPGLPARAVSICYSGCWFVSFFAVGSSVKETTRIIKITVGKITWWKNVKEMSGHSDQPQHALRRDKLRITQMAVRVPFVHLRQLFKNALRAWSRRKGAVVAFIIKPNASETSPADGHSCARNY